MWLSAVLIKAMADKRTDTFEQWLDEAASKLEAQLKFMRRQQAALPSLESGSPASVGLAAWEVGPQAEMPIQALKQQLNGELSQLAVAFWQEMALQASARGLEGASLEKMAASWAEQEPNYAEPISLAVGVFFLTIDWAADSASFSLGGVSVGKPCSLVPSSIIENLSQVEAELKEKQTIPRLALMRLVTAATVLSSERSDFTLAELWPIVHSIGLVAGNFGRHPSKANLSCYTKAQFFYDTVQAFKEMALSGAEGSPILWEGSLDSFSLESQVKIMRNGASHGK